jgi:hypothetical protein
MSDGPLVTAATLGPGHDGRAEVVIDLAYPNGGHTQLSIAQEVVTRVLDAAGLTSLEQLAGISWTVLVAGMATTGLDAT